MRRTVHHRPKWACTSRTIILNVAVLLVGVNGIIPVVTQYREIVPIPDSWMKRALLVAAVGNILLRRFTREPVSFRRPQHMVGGGLTGMPFDGWDADPDQQQPDDEPEGEA